MERALSLRDDFAAFMKTLDQIARGEGKLVELQETLSETCGQSTRRSRSTRPYTA